MTEQEILEQMKVIADKHGVEITETAQKIARFRARTGMPMNQCPCDKESLFRGCIGCLCMTEINLEGICHCKAFRKRS